MSVLHCDFETASALNLRKAGAYVYAHSPTTRVLCLAWAFDNEPVQVWRPGPPFPTRVLDHVRAGGEVHGWNVTFEYLIWNNVLPRNTYGLPKLDLDQLHCTMARAACWGLPMKLESAGHALGASIQKDKQGHELMMRMMKPRSIDPATGDPIWWHKTDTVKYDRLCAYCEVDVAAEREIANLIPNMPPWEREVWLMDARMNMRGMRLDTKAVLAMHWLALCEVADLDKRMKSVTNGQVASTSNVGALAAYANSFGFQNKGMANPVLDEMLTSCALPLELEAALRLRKQARKTSTKKLTAMQECCPGDDRVRGLFQYAGAGRTLRWAGRLIQPQNLPRPMKGLDTEAVIDAIIKGADTETVKLVFGDTLDVISSCLRSCLEAADGHLLAVCDYSAIEARVIAWLAGQGDILKLFAANQDVYTYAAHNVGSGSRPLGKALTLGCGFGMGWAKFIETALTYGVTLTDEEAQNYVGAWRKANSHIVDFWYALDNAAREAINNPGMKYMVGRITLRMGKNRMAGALIIELPNGGYLSYRSIGLEWEDGRENIVFWGVDPKNKQWSKQRTYGGKLAENITQSVARHLLADAMLRCEEHNIPLVGTIHDEIIAEPREDLGQATFLIMRHIMSHGPHWAKGLPLNGEGYLARRYAKG